LIRLTQESEIPKNAFTDQSRQKVKKRRIDIDDEGSIPDIRQSRNSTKQVITTDNGGLRELSGNSKSRPRPDDKVKIINKGNNRNEFRMPLSSLEQA
jgi:hypothetical protein